MQEEQQPSDSKEAELSTLPAEGQGTAPATPAGDDGLEFKPVVKYTAVGLALLLLGGVEYATYSVGHDRGYNSGFAYATESGMVQEAVNSTAVRNLTHFMQAAAASESTLLAMVENRDKELAWIREPAVRREAEWTLAQALMDRGMADKGKELFSALIPDAPQNPVWARRAALVAESFAAGGHEEEALAYYRLSAGIYAALQQTQEQIAVLSEMVELLAASPAPAAEVVASLDALQQDVTALGEPAKGLRSTILAYMGGIHRRTGDRENALRCFEQALQGMAPDAQPELASAAVSYGMALLEKGETEKAEKLLRDGAARLGDNPADVPFLVSALRELARIEQERGHTDEAIGLLYRVEGVATGRIPADNQFWPCLFDQRGWLNFVKQLHESAYADFSKAIEYTDHPALLPQPLEGAGRCCITLGKSDLAVQHLQRAIELRKQLLPEAKADLGRCLVLLGQVYDMERETDKAIASFTEALALLPADSPDARPARMSLAYNLSQAKRWSEAAEVWAALLAQPSERADEMQEIREQLALCRRSGPATPEPTAEEADDATSTAAPARSALPARPRVRRSRRR